MRQVFADTFYWLAITNPADQWHEAIRNLMLDIEDIYLVTTDEVLTEFLAGMSGLGSYHRNLATHAVRHILANQNVKVLPQSRESFLNGLDLYERRGDKHYSLTDCISMNACRSEDIAEILTRDHHFEQEGFTLLM